MATLDSTLIDNVDFARKSLKIHGIISVFNFLRLKDSLANSAGQVEVELLGWVDRFDNPMLELKVHGNLALTCQRCFEVVDYPVNLQFNYQIIANERMADNVSDEDDELDFLEAEHEMSLLELVEDELIVSMPISPLHVHDCESKFTLPKEKTNNPFAILEKLKKDA